MVARPRRRFKMTTVSDPGQPVAANVLGRQFTADGPNQRWVGDTSEFLAGYGTKLFVAAILDLDSRYVVGWAVNTVNDRHLTINALEMAIKRGVQPWVVAPLGSRLHLRQRGLPALVDDPRHHRQHQPSRQLL